MPFCKNCGSEQLEGAKFCMKCGSQMDAAAAPPVYTPPPSDTTAPPVFAAPPVPPVYEAPPQPPGAAPYYPPPPNGGYQTPNAGYAYQQAPPPQGPVGLTVTEAFRRAFSVLQKKPLKLWGLSLMYTLLTGFVTFLAVLPIISIPIVLVLQVGMTAIYLDGYREKEVDSNQLFQGFGNFFRNAGGMGWMLLWTMIWGLIPIAGPIIAIIKGYSYSFVPYILLNDSEISAVDALKKSMKMTEGYRGKMFGTQILIMLAVWVVMLVLGLLSRIPYAGILFTVIGAVVTIVAVALIPLIFGTLGAVFYDEAEKLSGE